MIKNRWSKEKAKNLDDLDLRVYSSNLLGSDSELVLHGGGNTSVKIDEILYVKGSGWDLATIKKKGFSPVKLESLKQMATLDSLSDSEMVRLQKKALSDKNAPNPSVEAILHAIIPYKFVDHTHANSIVTISNSIKGKELISKLYKDYLIVDYIMPGFILAKKIYELTKKDFIWDRCKGIILHNHGIFTFSNNAKESYDNMINSVNIAESFLDGIKLDIPPQNITKEYNLNKLKQLIEKEKESEVFFEIDNSNLAIFYSNQPNLKEFASKGVLTPEHIIRTKRKPLVLENDEVGTSLKEYIKDYENYFKKYSSDEIMLNPAPNYIVLKGFGVISIGKNEKEAKIISDIVKATMKAVLLANNLGGYKSISEKESFEIEYWELEQIKLRAPLKINIIHRRKNFGKDFKK